ncbi:hypothetical protein DNU06_03985 [Putridiphycobacter roseus]|uniref:Phage holin family protein n=1 Tax=Putridiphycobacter roseus TaxID=2219161 RepID=A0A2W1N0M5_9FLAO|nr:phage holin family protein [Putridiphycobacter roseus]PZE17787.1 hypothetical protein DNU06_03985 [Putridiphycobacter roseus]
MGLTDKIKKILNKFENYASSKIEAARLETVEKTINISSAVLSWFLIVIMGTFCLALFTVLAIMMLVQLTGDYLSATGIVMGIYLLVFVLLLLFYKKLLLRPIKNLLFGIYLSTYEKK